MDNGRIMKELKELQEGVKNVSKKTMENRSDLISNGAWDVTAVDKQLLPMVELESLQPIVYEHDLTWLNIGQGWTSCRG